MSTNNTIPLHTIDQIFPASAFKKALKLPVREMEETTKGTWVAFVDETSTSFDVQIVLQEGIIAQHQCDCDQYDEMGFCIHQLAVLQQLSTQKLAHVKPASKRKVKQDALDIIINQVEVAELRLWVKDLLKKNKDLLVAFTNQFTNTPTEFEAGEMLAITENGMKAVVKNKKKIDQTELKKILTLWQSLHEPVINFYIANVADAGKADVLGSLIQAITACENYLQINTNKIESYKRGLLQKTIQSIYELENEEIWEKVITELSKQHQKIKNNITLVWIQFLAELASLETRAHRTAFILKILLNLYTNIGRNNNQSTDTITKLIWKTCTEKEMTHLCIKILKPVITDPEFNTLLIQSLMAHQEWALAETHLHIIIGNQIYDEQKLPYLEILKTIYQQQPNRSNEMARLLINLIPLNFSYEDYLYLMKLSNDINIKEDIGKWKNKLIKHLDYIKSSNLRAAFLYFDILLKEKPTARVVNEISNLPSAKVVLLHFDELYKLNKLVLLKELSIFSSDYKYWNSDAEVFAELWKKVDNSYTSYEIFNVFMAKEKFKYTGNFYDWVIENINPKK